MIDLLLAATVIIGYLLLQLARRWKAAGTLEILGRSFALVAVPLGAVCIGTSNMPINQQPAVVRVAPLLYPNECALIVAEGEKFAKEHGGWRTARHRRFPTTDLALKDMPNLKRMIWGRLEKTVFPLMAETYNVPLEELAFKDVFLVKYSSLDGAQTGLPLHKDSGHISFNIALSDRSSFTGGGSWMSILNDTLPVAQGQVLLHPAGILHRGLEIESGTRYILVGFVWVNSLTSHWWLLWGSWSRCLQVVLHSPTGDANTTTCVSRKQHFSGFAQHWMKTIYDWHLVGFVGHFIVLTGLLAASHIFTTRFSYSDKNDDSSDDD